MIVVVMGVVGMTGVLVPLLAGIAFGMWMGWPEVASMATGFLLALFVGGVVMSVLNEKAHDA